MLRARTPVHRRASARAGRFLAIPGMDRRSRPVGRCWPAVVARARPRGDPPGRSARAGRFITVPGMERSQLLEPERFQLVRPLLDAGVKRRRFRVAVTSFQEIGAGVHFVLLSRGRGPFHGHDVLARRSAIVGQVSAEPKGTIGLSHGARSRHVGGIDRVEGHTRLHRRHATYQHLTANREDGAMRLARAGGSTQTKQETAPPGEGTAWEHGFRPRNQKASAESTSPPA